MPKGIRKPRRPIAAMPHEPAPSVALDEEEREILRTVEAGEWGEIPTWRRKNAAFRRSFGRSHRPGE